MKRTFGIVVVSVLVVSAIIWLRWAPQEKSVIGGGTSTTSPIAIEQSSTTPLVSPKRTGSEGGQISFPTPSLDRYAEPRIQISDFSKGDALKHIADLISILRKDSGDHSAWIMLGVYRKEIGDYVGAEEVWKYATLRWPADFIAYNNLGNLYHEQLRNFPKAEEYFLKTINLRPDFVQSYVNLYNLYRYSYTEKVSEAPKALERGLSKIPASIDLMIMLARYYTDKEDAINAAIYYRKAIDTAEESGSLQTVENLKKEAADAGLDL
jgi:tetratricopeptide (TPR) repeat protein